MGAEGGLWRDRPELRGVREEESMNLTQIAVRLARYWGLIGIILSAIYMISVASTTTMIGRIGIILGIWLLTLTFFSLLGAHRSNQIERAKEEP